MAVSSGRRVGVEERVHPHDGKGSVVLLPLVEDRLVLDLPALVARLHRPEHPAALRDPVELREHRLFDQIGELLDDERPLVRVLVLPESPLLVDDHLDGQRAPHRRLRGRGDRLVVGVGVQAVAVVVARDQRLQRGADVVEVDLLGVQGAPGGLGVVLELPAALPGAVPLAHRHRPDPARNPPHDRVLGIHPEGEEEGEVRREVVDVHAAREVCLDVGEAVGEGERELRDGVRARLGDVVAGDRHRVEVAHAVADEPLLDVAHHLQRELGGEDAGVLALVLLEDVRLHGAADVRERPRPDLLRLVRTGLAPVLVPEAVEPLVDGRVQEHRQDRRRGAVDGHGHRGRGITEVEAVVEGLHVVEGGDGHPRVAHLAVDVGDAARGRSRRA